MTGSDPLTGTTALNLGGARDGLLFLPSGYKPEAPAPLIVLLHGAGGSGTGFFSASRFGGQAAGAVVVAPDSRARPGTSPRAVSAPT